MSESKIQVGIIGASGYAGEDLARLLIGHPGVQLSLVTSRQYDGQDFSSIYPRFAQQPAVQGLKFSNPAPKDIKKQVDVVFLAVPHGVATEYARPLLDAGIRVIDLSADFRLKSALVYEEYYGAPHADPDLLQLSVYGLPERNREAIREAQLIACPGCYPTSILIPTLPLLERRLIQPDSIIANSLSGVSGAGRKVALDFLFVECNENMRAYGVPKHRHISEIEQEMNRALQEEGAARIQFTPHLIPVSRGIHTTLYWEPNARFGSANSFKESEFLNEVDKAWKQAYQGDPLVRLLNTYESRPLPETKNVLQSQFIDIAWRWDPRTRRLLGFSVIDNLTRGTSGQAVQCMNLMLGLNETEGLFN